MHSLQRFAFAIALGAASVSGLAAVPTVERNALLALYQSTAGDGWTFRTGWGGLPGTECDWDGITCNDDDTAVIDIYLDTNNLIGTLPPQVGDFAQLKSFRVPHNQLSGPIPLELLKLAQLDSLVLHDNQLTGTIPDFSDLQLKYLYLGSNRLEGTIPESLSTITTLEELVLDTNQLTGSIPASLGNLTSLRYLFLYDNQLTGSIPRELGSLRELTHLLLGFNKLSGEIPAELGQLSNLYSLQLYINELSGEIPGELFTLPQVEYFQVQGNHLSGTVPIDFTQMKKLRVLDLGYNEFVGTIPPELSQITTLEQLQLGSNHLTGTIPESLGTLPSLQILTLNNNELTGPIPLSLTNLSELQDLYLFTNHLTGTIPPELERNTKLATLLVGGNELTGTIPVGLMNLTNLTTLDVGGNHLVGTIPAQIGQLTRLNYLSMEGNDLAGPIPPSFSNLTELIDVRMGYNRFSGTLPSLAGMTKLEVLLLSENELEGPIPPQIGDLSTLKYLGLGQNKFSGTIPREIGRLSRLEFLGLDMNALRGPVPDEILGLTALQDGGSYFTYNALTTSNPAVDQFLTRKQSGNDWKSTQTVPPANVRISGQSANTVVLTWDRVGSVFDPGGYQVIATTPGGPTVIQTTSDKTLSAILVKGLSPLTNYSFVVHTVTYPNEIQKNLLVSDPSPPISGSTTANVPSGPLVVPTTLPFGLVQSDVEFEGRPDDYYTLSNFGDATTTITITQEGDFFTQEPPTLTLGPGEEATVSLSALTRPPGAYTGASLPAGPGVSAGLRVPVHLLSVIPPTGSVIAQATTNRVDLSAASDVQIHSGSAQFHNDGNATLNGLLLSDVPWLIPQSGLITIPPAQSVTVTFQIDRSKRSDDGTATGTLSLLYLQTSSSTATLRSTCKDAQSASRTGRRTTITHAKAGNCREILNGAATSVATATVTVVDTVKPPVAASDIPPLQAEEVALLIPGVGHLTGGNGLRTLSDVSIANAFAVDLLRDLRMYFTSETPAVATTSANLEQLPPSQGLMLGDVVKSVFNNDADSGTLQIRSLDWNKIVVSAQLVNVAPNGGSYGAAIPVFRSDRSTAPGDRLVLTGLRKGPGSRTDLVVQETSGLAAQVLIQYLSADGTILGTTEETLQPFRMRRIVDRVPAGAVTARVNNLAASAGRIVAYATPTDTVTGDFWTVVDWDRQFAALRTEPRLIPVAGAVRGMNGSSFRTDLDIVNVGPERATAHLIYYREDESSIEKDLTLEPDQTRSFANVAADFFNAPDSLGHIVITPRDSSLAITSRTYLTAASGTFAAGVPSIPLDAALRLGQSSVVGGVEIASRNTILAKKGGTYRTNVGLVETAGFPLTVRMTVFYADARAKSLGPLTTLTFDLNAHESRLVSNLSTLLYAFSRGADMRNVQLQFDVISGNGAVIIYTSSVENATGDAVIRMQ